MLRRLTAPMLAVLFGVVLLEAGARAVLFLLPERAPIELGRQRGDAEAARTRDLLYRPHQELFFRLAPNLDVKETRNPRVFDVKTNSLGMRGDEVVQPKPAGLVRVLAVGDSCTFGTGAGHTDNYPAQLAAALTSHLRGARADVLNAGVPGFTSYQALRYLEIEGFDLEPNAVVFASGVNDAAPATGKARRRLGAGSLLSDREYAAALEAQHFGFTRLLWRAGFRLGASRASAPEAAGVKRRVSLDDYAANLSRFAEQARARGIVPVVVLWPLRSQLSNPPAPRGFELLMADYQRAAAAAAAASDAILIDLKPTLTGHTHLFIDNVHLAPKGYGLVAKLVAKVLGPLLATGPTAPNI